MTCVYFLVYLRIVLAIEKHTEVSRISLFFNYLAITISFDMPPSRLQILSTRRNNVTKRNEILQVIAALSRNEIISDDMQVLIRRISSENKEVLMATVDGIKDAIHQLSLMQQAIECEVIIRNNSIELTRLNRRRDITQARIRMESETSTDPPPTYEQAMASQEQATQERRRQAQARQAQATQEEQQQ